MRVLLWLASAGMLFAQAPIDFSFAGYGGGGVALPGVPAVVSVRPTGGDDTSLLQGALDRVTRMTARGSGFRGAVLLRPGRYMVSGRLMMRAAGVVLRGSENTTIVAAGKGRRALIEVGAAEGPVLSEPWKIADETVPAGGRVFTIENAATWRTGDRVVITRPSTAAWIDVLKMRGLPGNYAALRLDWTPGSRDLVWDRTIERVDAGRITVDAPITTAIERRYGGGTVARVDSGGTVGHIGIENVVLESEFDPANGYDEEHSWIAVAIDRAEDVWVRNVTARHFAGSAVRVGPRARRVTVQDCRSEAPVSEPGGYRRQSFLVEGQQVLVRRCWSEQGMNDFASGLLAGGPNVFLESTAVRALGPSGSFESWASGVLYERVRVEGAGLWLTDGDTRAQGSGFTAANSVVWNCEAAEIRVHGPEGAENVAEQSNESLYEKQLSMRGPVSPTRGNYGDSTRLAGGPPGLPHPIEITGGRFTVGGKVVWGGIVNDGWWRGQEVPATALDAGRALTRFVPGRTAPGLTEDLAALADQMVRDGTPFYQFIPGLWYDRRRDEHSIVSRTNGDVWAPFYEMPWARTGKGRASDGLSLFDLSRFNPWYFGRLREFGLLAAERGLVLHYNLYNTHNVLEIPPHWVDYPWRPANNVNDTGLPEPPPIEPGNHIHVANQVYDISYPVRRALHSALILHTLEELGDLRNVFLCLGFQFAGPLEFQEFFQDTVAEWEKRTGKTVRLELATSKDITDAILENPARARQVAVIDMHYWAYRPDGSPVAPEGGKNLAFREMLGGDTPPNTTPWQVYRQVREYHDRYPDKAIVAWNGGAGPIPVLMAGGAEALMRNPSGGHGQGRSVDRTTLDGFVKEYLSGALMKMQPRDGVLESAEQNWCLMDDQAGTVLLYSLAGDSIRLAKTLSDRQYSAMWFDPQTGQTRTAAALKARAGDVIAKPTAAPWLLLLR